MAESKAKYWPWKKNNAGRSSRFIDIRGVRYIQWDHEKAPVHEYTSVQQTIPRSTPPVKQTDPEPLTQPYVINYALSTNPSSQATQGPRTSHPESILFPRSSAEGVPDSDDVPIGAHGHYEQVDAGRLTARSASTERAKTYHEDRHRSPQVVTTTVSTRRGAPSRSLSDTQPLVSASEGQMVESSADSSSHLSRLAQEFITIESGDYRTCKNFIDDYPHILDEEQSNFQLEALRLARAGKSSLFRNCVQQLLLLRECSCMSDESSEAFFRLLKSEDPETLKRFLGDFDRTREALRQKAAQGGPVQAGKRFGSDSVGLAGKGLSQGPPDRHAAEPIRRGSLDGGVTGSIAKLAISRRDDQDQHRGYGPTSTNTGLPTTRHLAGTGGGQALGSVNEDPVSEAISDRYSQAEDASIVLADIRGNGEAQEELDHRYKKRLDAKHFFVIGRVFALLWHEGTADVKGGYLSQAEPLVGKYNQRVFSHIRRMVVVKERHGYCWCIPINTYNYQGVAKKGLSWENRAAHSIIHMADTSPAISKSEKGLMVKKPIAVIAAQPDQKLHQMSRINFGKPYSVEWNVKVMNVGKVHKDSMNVFMGYWSNEQNA